MVNEDTFFLDNASILAFLRLVTFGIEHVIGVKSIDERGFMCLFLDCILKVVKALFLSFISDFSVGPKDWEPGLRELV